MPDPPLILFTIKLLISVIDPLDIPRRKIRAYITGIEGRRVKPRRHSGTIAAAAVMDFLCPICPAAAG